MSSDSKMADLVLFFPRGNFVKVLCEETERLKVVLGQLMKPSLELEHSKLAVLYPICSNYTLVQICTVHTHTHNIKDERHVIRNTSNI